MFKTLTVIHYNTNTPYSNNEPSYTLVLFFKKALDAKLDMLDKLLT